MICTRCKEAGQASRVYPGSAVRTDMYCRPFYDKEGRLHDHDRNVTTTSYTCSNGHAWTEARTGACWCGWPAVDVGGE